MSLTKVQKYAKVLFSLHQNGFLADPDFNPVVGMLIRESMETPSPHCTTDHRSKGAAAAIDQAAPATRAKYQAWCRTNLHHEHIVPTSVRIKILLKEPNLTEEFIARSLQTYGVRATILKAEDDVLNKAGLKAKMPDAFWTPGSALYMNPMARYIETGLDKDLDGRPGACWFSDEPDEPTE